MKKSSVAPTRTYALVVGIEKYMPGLGPDLDGPAHDAYKFIDWLVSREVPRKNIAQVLSPLDSKNDALDESPRWPATRKGVSDAVHQWLKKQTGDLLWVFWGGHGMMTEARSRRLFYADTTREDWHHLDLNSLLTHLSSDNLSGFQQQIYLIDTCANYGLPQERLGDGDRFPPGKLVRGREQFVFFATREGEVAKNIAQEQTGLFSKVVLGELEKEAFISWPPDIEKLAGRVQEYFADPVKVGKTKQKPIFASYRTGDGSEYSLIQQAEQAPTIWMVPYARNPFFTGRDAVLADLHERFQKGRAQAVSQPQAMSGLGGIGKTQIAVEYAYRYRENYREVLWASAETVELLNTAFTQIATKLDLSEQGAQEQEVIVEAVKWWLGEHEGWLLILDNADEPEVLEAFLPPAVGGQVVVTTRASDLTSLGLGFGHALEVETFTAEQGALFLLHRVGVLALDAGLDQAKAEDGQRAMELSEELGGLPLALDQAGAYIAQTRCTLAGYQQLYQTHRRQLLKERRGKKEHPDPVATTWHLSFERVEAANGVAAELLRLCSFLAPDAIAEWMLIKGTEQVGPLLAPVVADEYLLNQAIETLRGYSLLKRDVQAGMLSVHRLVQAVVRDAMTEEEERAWKQRVLLLLKEVCPDVSNVEEWPLCEQWVSHALVSVKSLEEAVVQTEVAAVVCNAAGYYLQARGRYQEAEPLYRRALEIREQELGPGHPDTAVSLNNLAGLYHAQGKYSEAEPLMKRALEIRKQALGERHPKTATSLNNLARLYQAQGKYSEAEPLMKRAFAIDSEMYGVDHPEVATDLNNLGGLYHAQGKYAEAEPLYRRALEIWEQELGPGHPDTAVSVNNLAVLYRAQGKYAEAEPLYRRALEIREQELGPGHPDTAVSVNNLAGFYHAQGKYAEAEPLFRRALEIWEQSVGTEHPNTASTIFWLAVVTQQQKRYAEALGWYERAWGIYKRVLGVTHPTTRNLRNYYAGLLRVLGREEEAVALEAEGD